MKRDKFIRVDREIMGGEPVFAGTRVPVKTLFEHLQSGCTLEEFLKWFPTVSREAATKTIAKAETPAIHRFQWIAAGPRQAPEVRHIYRNKRSNGPELRRSDIDPGITRKVPLDRKSVV